MKINLIAFVLLLSGLSAKCQDASAPINSHPVMTNTTKSPKAFASPGCVELGGSVSYTSSSESYYPPSQYGYNGSTRPINTFLFASYVGYFPVQGFELGLNPLSVSSTDSYGNQTSLLFAFAPSYNISTHSNVYPFIEGDVGYNSNSGPYSTAISGMCYGGRVGFKFVIAPHALLTFAAQYLIQNYNLTGSAQYNGQNTYTQESLSNFVCWSRLWYLFIIDTAPTYLAILTALVSRITVTLTCPG